MDGDHMSLHWQLTIYRRNGQLGGVLRRHMITEDRADYYKIEFNIALVLILEYPCIGILVCGFVQVS